MTKTLNRFVLLASVASMYATQAHGAETFGGVEFPQGALSFADAVVSYDPGPVAPSMPYQGAFNALGVPDYAGGSSCSSQADCSFLTLGDGGSVVLRFVDNLLTGSGSADDDLWIFEIGSDVENTFVDISSDGVTWSSVGFVGGATSGIDIDAFGFGAGDTFSYVRLTDDTNEGQQSGSTVGADIDAVGAISTIAAPGVPEPATWLTMVLGFGLVGGTMRARRNRPGIPRAAR